VIVRARDEVRTIGRTLEALRAQTVPVEIIVVDSGSRDGTLEVARPMCDRLIQMDPREFTYGRALNVGARAATAPIHIALSAHCRPERADWVELTLALYDRDDVAGTGGGGLLPDGRRFDGVFYQDAAHARAHPEWGFSNHAGSWRADVWQRFPFHEGLEASEDKEWALRVVAEGYVIAFRPELYVDLSHRWRAGAAALYHRQRREASAMASIAPWHRYTLADWVREWWGRIPDDGRPAMAHRFLNYKRLAGLAGRLVGARQGRRRGVRAGRRRR
jgi:rhamnosyltransferase